MPVLMRSRRSFSERWASPVKCSPPFEFPQGMGDGIRVCTCMVGTRLEEAENNPARRIRPMPLQHLPAPAAAILLGLGSSANAQAIPWVNGEFASPWNAQKIFEPSSLPDRTDPDTREEIPPEDMPVKKRQQPGYEPVGIRSGSWMFNPSLTAGSFLRQQRLCVEHRAALRYRGGDRADAARALAMGAAWRRPEAGCAVDGL